MILGLNCEVFRWSWDSFLWFLVLGDRLENSWFFMAAWGGPRSCAPAGGWWSHSFRVPNETSRMQETLLSIQYNIKHAGIQGYENTRMQNEKQRTPGYRIEEMLRSLVAPLKRGRRIKSLIIHLLVFRYRRSCEDNGTQWHPMETEKSLEHGKELLYRTSI